MRLLRISLCVLLGIVFCGSSAAQAPDLVLSDGVKKHAGIDRIYSDFSKSYKTLDIELLADLYSSDAAYLPPNQEVLLGIQDIRTNFTDFFENIKQSKRSMTIKFEIIKRRVESNMGFDIGKFEIGFMQDGKAIGTSTGKFAVVAVKEKDGKWRFAVDSYSPLEPAK